MSLLNRKAISFLHGAVSVINAIAIGKGSALGISLGVKVEIEISSKYKKSNYDAHGTLISNIIKRIIPSEIINTHSISIKIYSDIPIGYGLKSSSAISNAVSLACSSIMHNEIDDESVLEYAVLSSLESKVSITGAYDDAAACYYGGFVLTDNYNKKLLRRVEAPNDLCAIIFLPYNTKRGNVPDLMFFSDLFLEAFRIAEEGNYWKAMNFNGVLTSSALSYNYVPILQLIKKGVLAAGISGNGPAVVAIDYEKNINCVKEEFEKFSGRVIISKINNTKARVERMIG